MPPSSQSTPGICPPQAEISARAAWLIRAAIVLLVALLTYTKAKSATEPWFPVDDAYITAHNAEALWLGADPVFGEATGLHGATSPVHTFLVAALLWLGSLEWALFAAEWLAIGLYALGVFELAKALRLSVPRALLVVAVAALIGRTPHILTNGLETGLAMACVAWALAFQVRDGSTHRVAVPLLLGISPFLRPELIAFSAMLLALRAVVRVHESWQVIRSAWRVIVLSSASDVVLMLAAASPFAIAEVVTTGALWPPTIEAKRFWFAEGCLPYSHLRTSMSASLSMFRTDLGAALWIAPFLFLSRLGIACVGVLAAFVFAYFESFPAALTHYEGRYWYIFIPMMILGLAVALSSRRKAVGVIAAALAMWIVVEAFQKWNDRFFLHEAGRNFTRHELAKAAEWVNKNVQPSKRILIHDAGYIGAKAKAQFIDIVGLKTPSSVEVNRDFTWFTCEVTGRWRAIQVIAEMQKPDYVIVLDGWDRVYGIIHALRLGGLNLDKVGPDGSYVIYRVRHAK